MLAAGLMRRKSLNKCLPRLVWCIGCRVLLTNTLCWKRSGLNSRKALKHWWTGLAALHESAPKRNLALAGVGVAEDRPGFLGRWGRRKNDTLQGKPLDEPAAPVNNLPVPASPVSSVLATAKPEPETAPQESAPEKLLSLDDVKLLTQESDFSPFMAGNVSSDVRNAAMKKLFTDPHYNVMDGLDIYIGDYSLADPIPESMLRQMVGARLLKIFNEDDENNESSQQAIAAQAPVDSSSPDDLNNPTSEIVAQSGNSSAIHSPKTLSAEFSSQPETFKDPGASQPDDHAHSHLRLQPDHAPSAPSAGHGT